MDDPGPAALRAAVAGISYFGGLDATAVDELARAALWRGYAAGAVVFLAGEAAAGLYCVHRGWLKVARSAPDGREQVLRYIGPGEVFNEVGAFAGRPNPATAITLEPVGLWVIERSSVRRVLTAQPALAIQVLERMAGRVVDLVDLVSELSLNSVAARLASLLLDQAEGDRLVRPPWATQAELAARLGTVPDVLGRALRTLTEAGLVAMDRQSIRILDREGLELRANRLA